VTVPLAWVLWGLPEHLVEKLLSGAVVEEPEDMAAEMDMARFAQWHEDLSWGGEGREEAVLLELKARLLRLAAAVRGRARPQGAPRALASAGGGAPTSVERMATFVARHYRDPVGLEEVAREVRLHPDCAAALFRKAFGVTPTRFILQHRVSHAQRSSSRATRRSWRWRWRRASGR
jgi:AraC family transcriptional regulator, melibiose operon regulatory protein